MRVFNQEQYDSGQKKKLWVILIVFVGIIAVVMAGMRLIGSQQDIRNRAAEPTPTSINCPANGAICRWSAVVGASGYQYTIEKKTNGVWVPVQPTCACPTQPAGATPTTGVTQCGCTTTQTQVNFTSEAGQTYRCTVRALSANPLCQNLSLYATELTCPITTTTPTSTATPSATITASPSATLIPKSPTPSKSPTATPRLTGGPTGGLAGLNAAQEGDDELEGERAVPTINEPTKTPTPTKKVITPTPTIDRNLENNSKPDEKIIKPSPTKIILPTKTPVPTKIKLDRINEPPPKAGTMTNLLILVGISLTIIIFGFVL